MRIPLEAKDVKPFNICLLRLMIQDPDRYRMAPEFIDQMETYYRIMETPSEKVEAFFQKWGSRGG